MEGAVLKKKNQRGKFNPKWPFSSRSKFKLKEEIKATTKGRMQEGIPLLVLNTHWGVLSECGRGRGLCAILPFFPFIFFYGVGKDTYKAWGGSPSIPLPPAEGKVGSGDFCKNITVVKERQG